MMMTAETAAVIQLPVAPAAAEETCIHELDPMILKAWLNAGDALLVDVRETHEYEIERIAGAMLMPLSFFDAASFPVLPGKKLVLMCAIGKRSMAAAKQLINAGFGEAYNLKGGINAWKAAGLPTDTE